MAYTYNEAKIISALNDRFLSLSVSGVTLKQYHDKSFTKPTQAPYLRASWVHTETTRPCIAYSDPQAYGGIFQVDLFQPVDSGAEVPAERIGAIISHFKPGTTMTQDSLTVKVLKAWPGPTMRDDGFWMYPVSIRVQAFKAQV